MVQALAKELRILVIPSPDLKKMLVQPPDLVNLQVLPGRPLHLRPTPTHSLHRRMLTVDEGGGPEVTNKIDQEECVGTRPVDIGWTPPVPMLGPGMPENREWGRQLTKIGYVLVIPTANEMRNKWMFF